MKIRAENDRKASINWTKNPKEPKNEQAPEHFDGFIVKVLDHEAAYFQQHTAAAPSKQTIWILA